MEITSAVVYKPQLQTALEKKTVDVFCRNLKNEAVFLYCSLKRLEKST